MSTPNTYRATAVWQVGYDTLLEAVVAVEARPSRAVLMRLLDLAVDGTLHRTDIAARVVANDKAVPLFFRALRRCDRDLQVRGWIPAQSQGAPPISQGAQQRVSQRSQGCPSREPGCPRTEPGFPKAKSQGAPVKSQGAPAKSQGNPAQSQGAPAQSQGRPRRRARVPQRRARVPQHRARVSPAKSQGAPTRNQDSTIDWLISKPVARILGLDPLLNRGRGPGHLPGARSALRGVARGGGARPAAAGAAKLVPPPGLPPAAPAPRRRAAGACLRCVTAYMKRNTLPLEAGGRCASTTMSSWGLGPRSHAVVFPRQSIYGLLCRGGTGHRAIKGQGSLGC
eukprot:1195500-Prorocentrum_minimum.AAC.25